MLCNPVARFIGWLTGDGRGFLWLVMFVALFIVANGEAAGQFCCMKRSFPIEGESAPYDQLMCDLRQTTGLQPVLQRLGSVSSQEEQVPVTV